MSSLWRVVLSSVCGLWLIGAATAFAQSGSSTATPAAPPLPKPPPGFEPVAGAPDTQQLDPNPLVIGAYAAIFFGVFGYVVYVARKQTELAKEMTELGDRIRRAEKS